MTNKKASYEFSIKRYLISLLYLVLLTVSISVFVDDLSQQTLLQLFFFMAMVTLVLQSVIGLIVNRYKRKKNK
jgi:heme/copper-type cytochrome/quinol oxidase subunit 4